VTSTPARGRLLADSLDLVVVAVDEPDTVARMLGLAAAGLVADLADDLRGIVGDGCGEPLAVRPGPGFACWRSLSSAGRMSVTLRAAGACLDQTPRGAPIPLAA
jgi:hypothetical protein